VEVLVKLAKVLKKNRSYQLACKKYTQAGDKIRAIKCLILSGEIDKVIFFANTARDSEVYKLAANHLMTLGNLADQKDLKKTIELFLTKAKDQETLKIFKEIVGEEETYSSNLLPQRLMRSQRPAADTTIDEDIKEEF
jgi:intraflagellar transport protein 140